MSDQMGELACGVPIRVICRCSLCDGPLSEVRGYVVGPISKVLIPAIHLPRSLIRPPPHTR